MPTKCMKKEMLSSVCRGTPAPAAAGHLFQVNFSQNNEHAHILSVPCGLHSSETTSRKCSRAFTKRRVYLCDPRDDNPGLLCPRDSPGKNTGQDSHSFLQGIFLTQRSNPALLHYRQILYCPSHPGSPRTFIAVFMARDWA